MLKRSAGSITHQGSDATQSEQGISGRVALAVAVAMGAAAAAQAQTAPQASAGLEEIVVTATRRAESIQDVPISVSAFSTEKMDIQGVKSVDDIARLTPGINFSRGGFGSTSLGGTSVSIRGVGSSAGSAPIGIYIDDTPIQVPSVTPSGNFNDDAFPQLFDIQRVEVLRGPQGTLFGAGAEGGAVRFITPGPNFDKASVYAKTDVSTTTYGDPSYEAGIAGGAPIIDDKLAFRASVWTRRDGGYVDQVDYYTGQTLNPNNNSTQSTSARLALGWKPIDGLTITPSVFYQKVRAQGSNRFWLHGDNSPATDPNVKQFVPLTQPWGDVANGHYVNLSQTIPTSVQRLALPALKAEWMLPHNMEIISNTSYYDREEHTVADYTGLHVGNFAGLLFASPIWNAASQQEQVNKYFTQEVRLQSTASDSPLQWQTGLFYSHDVNEGNGQTYDPYLGDILTKAGRCATPVGCVQAIYGQPLLDGVYTFRSNSKVTETQKAVFGQLDYKLPLHLIATVGLRYSKYTNDLYNPNGGPTTSKPWPTVITGSAAHSVVTPKYVLSYKMDNLLVYGSASKGFRNGGAIPPVTDNRCAASLPLLGLKDYPTAYKPDSLWSYELGSKWTGLNGRLTLAASVFDIEWKDQIRNVSLPTCAYQYTANIGAAQSRGFDLEMTYRLLDPLTLSLNGGYQMVKAKQTILPAPGSQYHTVTAGDALDGSYPTVNAAAQYAFEIAEHASYFRVDYNYTGRTARGTSFNPQDQDYPNPATNAPYTLFRDPPLHTTNVRLGSQFGNWDISLYSNNLFNAQPLLLQQRTTVTFAGVLSGQMEAQTLRPRTSGITAVYRY